LTRNGCVQLLKHPACLIPLSRRSISVSKRSLKIAIASREIHRFFELGCHRILAPLFINVNQAKWLRGKWKLGSISIAFLSVSTAERSATSIRDCCLRSRKEDHPEAHPPAARLSPILTARLLASFRRSSINRFGYHLNVPVVAAVVVQCPSQLRNRNCRIAFLDKDNNPCFSTRRPSRFTRASNRSNALAVTRWPSHRCNRSGGLTENAQNSYKQ